MSTTAVPRSNDRNRPLQSCVRCGERKVKCDRQNPCSACVKHHLDCVYHSGRPSRTRNQRVKDLSDRLKQCEALLQQHGIAATPSQLPQQAHGPALHSNSSRTTITFNEDSNVHAPNPIHASSGQADRTQVLQAEGNSKIVDNNLWTRVAEEIHDTPETFGGATDDHDQRSDQELSSNECDFVFDKSFRRTHSSTAYPEPEQIRQLWSMYATNVDPLTKVVHAPTLRTAINHAADNISTVPSTLKALMFAIYSAAVMSSNEDECQLKFGEPRKILLKRYVSATKRALSQAGFMQTTSLVVLQALAIHLISVRDFEEPRAVWSLTGVAVRIAQSMGLDRDGEVLGLPPFETEMRRRIWWWLKTHDFRTAELCGLSKFRDLDTGGENPRWPMNVGEDQLSPGMKIWPTESTTLTDMVFVVVRHEFTNVAAEHVSKFRNTGSKVPSHWTPDIGPGRKLDIGESVKKIQDHLETKYLRYCDPVHPLHMITMLMARAALNHIRFMAHHPRRYSSIEEIPEAEKTIVWDLCMNMLEQHIMAQSNPLIQRFAWHASYTMQWHSLIHVLDMLRLYPDIAEAEKAWSVMGETYGNNPEMLSDMRKPIHIAVGSLCLKAWNARETASQIGAWTFNPTPDFISRLKEQQEANVTKKSNRATSRESTKQVSADNLQTSIGEAAQTDNHTALDTEMIFEEEQSQQHPSLGHPEPSGSNPFYYLESYDDNQLNSMQQSMDLDFILGQNQTSDDTFQIDWDQWDAFVAESNLMGPLS